MSEAARRGGPMAAALFSVLLLAASPAAAQRDFADGPLEFLRRVPPFGFFFGDRLPQNYPEVLATDKERFNRFFHGMLERGVYLAPALYEAGFVSTPHSQADIEATVAAAREVLATL